jgi:hypothetical protein
MHIAEPNIFWGPGSTPCMNLDLRFEPEPREYDQKFFFIAPFTCTAGNKCVLLEPPQWNVDACLCIVIDSLISLPHGPHQVPIGTGSFICSILDDAAFWPTFVSPHSANDPPGPLVHLTLPPDVKCRTLPQPFRSIFELSLLPFLATIPSISSNMPPWHEAGLIPHHVAFTMDGNRRYARNKGVKVIQGHVGNTLYSPTAPPLS